jgi:5-methylcytosine-specific restriction endonuclease McrA
MSEMDKEHLEQMARCSRETNREPDGTHKFDPDSHWAYPFWCCDACGGGTFEPFVVGGVILLCDSCSGSVANYWNHAHSGEYITWPNQRFQNNKDNRSKISASKRKRLHERDAYRCRYCGGYENLVLDHVIPLSRDGSDDDENLVTACWSCNSRKSDRTPEEAGMVLQPVSVV